MRQKENSDDVGGGMRHSARKKTPVQTAAGAYQHHHHPPERVSERGLQKKKRNCMKPSSEAYYVLPFLSSDQYPLPYVVFSVLRPLVLVLVLLVNGTEAGTVIQKIR